MYYILELFLIMGKYIIYMKKRHKVAKQRRKDKKILKKLESVFILFVWILIILMLYEIIEYILFSNRELC